MELNVKETLIYNWQQLYNIGEIKLNSTKHWFKYNKGCRKIQIWQNEIKNTKCNWWNRSL